jgi:hypothetical protein
VRDRLAHRTAPGAGQRRRRPDGIHFTRRLTCVRCRARIGSPRVVPTGEELERAMALGLDFACSAGEARVSGRAGWSASPRSPCALASRLCDRRPAPGLRDGVARRPRYGVAMIRGAWS